MCRCGQPCIALVGEPRIEHPVGLLAVAGRAAGGCAAADEGGPARQTGGGLAEGEAVDRYRDADRYGMDQRGEAVALVAPPLQPEPIEVQRAGAEYGMERKKRVEGV